MSCPASSKSITKNPLTTHINPCMYTPKLSVPITPESSLRYCSWTKVGIVCVSMLTFYVCFHRPPSTWPRSPFFMWLDRGGHLPWHLQGLKLPMLKNVDFCLYPHVFGLCTPPSAGTICYFFSPQTTVVDQPTFQAATHQDSDMKGKNCPKAGFELDLEKIEKAKKVSPEPQFLRSHLAVAGRQGLGR